jgi:hypothetical protein
MNNTIKIVGIDQQRPPRVRKEAYIDLVLKLSDKAPSDWIDLFDTLGRHMDPAVKMEKATGTCIMAWVRTMDDIPAHFDKIKQTVQTCNLQYEEQLQQKLAAAQISSESAASQQQARLNAIIAALNFD